MLLVDLLVLVAQLDQALGRHVGVELGLVLRLDLVERLFEMLVIDAHHHVAEHVDQAAVGVVGEPLVARRLGQALDRLVVQAQVQDRVHHAGHRRRGAGAHRNQQRVLVVAELLAELLFEHGDVLVDLVHQRFRELPARS